MPSNSMQRACQVEALPPWSLSRDRMKLSEVPAYLKKLYNIPVSYGSVLRWAREGVLRRSDGEMIYLRCTQFGRWRFVTKPDLIAFMEAMI